jgi:hypothetical protein
MAKDPQAMAAAKHAAAGALRGGLKTATQVAGIPGAATGDLINAGVMGAGMGAIGGLGMYGFDRGLGWGVGALRDRAHRAEIEGMAQQAQTPNDLLGVADEMALRTNMKRDVYSQPATAQLFSKIGSKLTGQPETVRTSQLMTSPDIQGYQQGNTATGSSPGYQAGLEDAARETETAAKLAPGALGRHTPASPVNQMTQFSPEMLGHYGIQALRAMQGVQGGRGGIGFGGKGDAGYSVGQGFQGPGLGSMVGPDDAAFGGKSQSNNFGGVFGGGGSGGGGASVGGQGGFDNGVEAGIASDSESGGHGW